MFTRKSDQWLALEDAIASARRSILRVKGFKKTEIAFNIATLRDMQTALGED